jgi:hypothetical protein
VSRCWNRTSVGYGHVGCRLRRGTARVAAMCSCLQTGEEQPEWPQCARVCKRERNNQSGRIVLVSANGRGTTRVAVMCSCLQTGEEQPEWPQCARVCKHMAVEGREMCARYLTRCPRPGAKFCDIGQPRAVPVASVWTSASPKNTLPLPNLKISFAIS